MSIFFPNNTLHDGGVIIQGDKITCARAVFPISENTKVIKRLGTRHRAALGISELTDCIALIVSEETGIISVAVDGKFTRGFTEKKLMDHIEELFVGDNTKNGGKIKDGRKK